MESSTEALRRMLDERGVEWKATKGAVDTIWTHWDMFTGHRVHAMDNEDGTVEICGEWDMTPEQAIAATLGRGEWSDFDMRMAYHMGYDDALAKRKPDAGKVVTNG